MSQVLAVRVNWRANVRQKGNSTPQALLYDSELAISHSHTQCVIYSNCTQFISLHHAQICTVVLQRSTLLLST